MTWMGLRQQGKAVGVGEGAREAGRPRRLPTPSDEKKQNNACPTMPCACPWPLAACPSPEAIHNKADLNKMMSLPIRSESGARVRAVGLAVRQRGLGTQKERKNEPKKYPHPAPWALPHTSPRSYPRPSFLRKITNDSTQAGGEGGWCEGGGASGRREDGG